MVRSRFEPAPRPERHYDRIPADARSAAVLVLLYEHEGRWHIPLTLRPSHLPDHGGQVSFPGGAVEPGETASAAALREFREELGGAETPIELLGPLSPIYVAASNFRVAPWVGSCARRPVLTPSPAEVEAVLEIPLAHLLDPANFGSHRRQDQGTPYTAPHFQWGPYRIWGATCMILGELVTLLKELRAAGWQEP